MYAHIHTCENFKLLFNPFGAYGTPYGSLTGPDFGPRGASWGPLGVNLEAWAVPWASGPISMGPPGCFLGSLVCLVCSLGSLLALGCILGPGRPPGRIIRWAHAFGTLWEPHGNLTAILRELSRGWLTGLKSLLLPSLGFLG